MKYIQYIAPSIPLGKIASNYNFDNNFTYEVCTYNNIEKNITIIESIDKCLPTWKTRPTINNLNDRFDSGSFVMYQYYKDELCGWFWLNSHFTHDWINLKPIQPNSIYVGGLYKLLDKELPKHTALDFGNYVMKYGADNYDYLYAIIEDWNRASRIVFEPYKEFIIQDSFI
jgi:hypothetical protein